MNYSALVSAICSYTENTFPATTLFDGTVVSPTTQINTFITQAEQRIYNSVQFPSLRKNVTGTTTASNPYLNCPTDFLSAYSVAVYPVGGGAYSYLLNKDVNFIREAYPDPSSTGQPKFYALFGPDYTVPTELTFILGPTPDISYKIELHYFFYPESITTISGGVTWLSENFDTVLLYGALVEAYTYMKGEQDMMALYDGKYKEALILAKRLGDGLERQDAFRSGQYRQPVN